MASIVRRVLFKMFSFEQYLSLLSTFFFISYRLGILRNNPKYTYHYFIPGLIKKGDHVLDIGANLGYFSVLFAQKAGPSGRVHAVEPIGPILSVLRQNLRRFTNATIYPYALGNEEKAIALVNDTRERLGYIASGSHSVFSGNHAKVEDADYFEAQMKRGSELFKDLERLDFIKCDIEGHETVVIPEIIDLIKRFRPLMLIETKGPKRIELMTLLGGIDYRALHCENEVLKETSEEAEDDILFVPKEKIDRLDLN